MFRVKSLDYKSHVLGSRKHVETKFMKIVNIGLSLQVIFVLFHLLQIRAFVLNRFGLYAVVYIELTLSIISLILGIIAFILNVRVKRTVFVISFGLLSCLWFVVIYLLPEAGIPPALPWLYSD